MRPVSRRLHAALVTSLPLAALVAGCADDPPPTHQIAILRAVEPGENEAAFLPALARFGIDRDRLEVLSGDEAYPDADAAEAAVERWVADGVDLIVALSTGSAQAAARVTSTIPILFLVNDPRVAGLVEDERNPEANLTGATYRIPADRVLVVASEAFGEIEDVGCVHPGVDPAVAAVRQELIRGAATFDLRVQCESFDEPQDARAATQRLLQAGVDVLVPLSSPGTVEAFPHIEQALTDSDVPVVTTTPWDAAALTLVPDGAAVYRQLAGQAARLLAGDPVAEVPVEDPSGYRMTVNLRVAERLGITVPEAVIERADDVVR